MSLTHPQSCASKHEYGQSHEHEHEHGHEHAHHHPAGTEHASILSGSCSFRLSDPVPLSRIACEAERILSGLSLSPSVPDGAAGEPLPGHIKMILVTVEGARCSLSSTIRGEASATPLPGWDAGNTTSAFQAVLDIILLTEEHPEPEQFFSLLAECLPVSERSSEKNGRDF